MKKELNLIIKTGLPYYIAGLLMMISTLITIDYIPVKDFLNLGEVERDLHILKEIRCFSFFVIGLLMLVGGSLVDLAWLKKHGEDD